MGVTAINSSVGLAQGFGVEFMFTFVLVFLIFSITDSKKNTEPYGMSLGIGLVIVVCVLGAVSIYLRITKFFCVQLCS